LKIKTMLTPILLVFLIVPLEFHVDMYVPYVAIVKGQDWVAGNLPASARPTSLLRGLALEIYHKEKEEKGKERKGKEGTRLTLVVHFLPGFPPALSPRANLRFVGTH
jgi:hypothetical protein